VPGDQCVVVFAPSGCDGRAQGEAARQALNGIAA